MHGLTVRVLFFRHTSKKNHRKILSKTKEPIADKNRTNVVFQAQYKDCKYQYTKQTEKKLGTRIHEHRLTTKRHETLSQFTPVLRNLFCWQIARSNLGTSDVNTSSPSPNKDGDDPSGQPVLSFHKR